MGYYSDEFFKEYEELYSDTKLRDEARRQQEREAERSDTSDRNQNQYRTGRSNSRTASGRNAAERYDSYRTKRYTPPNRGGSRPVQQPRDRYNGNPYQKDSYDSRLDRYGFDDRQAQRSPRDRSQSSRSTSVRLKRRTRRIIILSSFIAVALVIIVCLVALISSSGVGKVPSLEAKEVTVDSVVLTWEKADHAERYRVAMAKDGSDSFEEVQTVDDTDTLTVSDLEQASEYSFRVTALRKGKEGKPATVKDVWTLPQSPQITNIFSAKAGTLHVDWTQNDKASGYVVEYKKDGGEYQSMTVPGSEECRADIPDLDPEASYTVRVSAYLDADKKVDSAPSDEQSVTVVAEDTEIQPKAMDQKVDGAIDPDKPMVALTFDDGPAVGGDAGDRILDVLEKNGAKATFFMVGCNVAEAPENMKRKVDLGMEIGNHTWNHTHFGSEVTPDDIRKASNEIYDVCGQYPTCFRSPGGMTTGAILQECAGENMPAYYWTIDTEDWKSRDADKVYDAVMDHVKDGDIILMHEIYGSTADAVEKMVPELIKRGFQLVTCHDLVACKTGADPAPGTQYNSGSTTMDP